jgi:hypothetical protein
MVLMTFPQPYLRYDEGQATIDKVRAQNSIKFYAIVFFLSSDNYHR